jgi:hypothetical protein
MNENDIDLAETRVGLKAIREVLYGGERGPGLIYSVASLADSIAKLSETVATISHDLNHDNGVKANMRELNVKMERIEKFASKMVFILALIGAGSLLTTGRIAYTIIESILKEGVLK